MNSNTLMFGWPCAIPVVMYKDRIFLSLDESFKVLGIYGRKIKRGFKIFDSFFFDNGLSVKDNYITENGQTGKRTHLSIDAFITLIYSGSHFRDTEDVVKTYCDIVTFNNILYSTRDHFMEKCISVLSSNRQLQPFHHTEGSFSAKRGKG